MEKVKLTQEQADSVEIYKEYGHNLAVFVANHRGFHSELEPLKTIPIDDMARILYQPNSYEVDPKFKIGDTVFVNWRNRKGDFYKVEDVLTCGQVVIDNKGNTMPGMDIVRLATPEEIFWNDNDRDVWELKENDVLRRKNGKLVFVSEATDYKVYYEHGTWDFISDVRKYYKVFCFAKDRKDI